MANWTKKLTKAAAADLEPGEEVRSALFLQPAGTTTRLVARGLAGVVGAAIASRSGGGGGSDLVTDAGIAASLPDQPVVVGLTGRRVLVFGHSSLSGKPKGLLLALGLDQLARVDTEPQKATWAVVLHFADGTASVREAPRLGNDPQEFAALLGG